MITDGMLLQTAIILLIIAGAIGLCRSEFVTLQRLVRVIYRVIMFLPYLVHELSAVIVNRMNWLFTGDMLKLRFDNPHKPSMSELFENYKRR